MRQTFDQCATGATKADDAVLTKTRSLTDGEAVAMRFLFIEERERTAKLQKKNDYARLMKTGFSISASALRTIWGLKTTKNALADTLMTCAGKGI